MKRSVSARFLITSNRELLTEFGPVNMVIDDMMTTATTTTSIMSNMD
jgi:hypothetical protein